MTLYHINFFVAAWFLNHYLCHLRLSSGDTEGVLFNLLHYSMKQLQILTSGTGKLRLRAHLHKIT